MKKTLLHSALLALSFPFSLHGLGLGQMTVKSSLDQPFLAEIDVIDVGNLPITSIKIGIADPESFEEIGLDRAAVLSLLNFKLEKNQQGKLIVKVQSTERMVDPYMELVVDMAWPKGQLYKAYTILLDPPGYQLVLTTIQGSPTRYRKTTTYSNEPGVVNKTVHTTVAHNPPLKKDRKKKTTYGPTISHENVWQIAQRYKTSEVILPQIVLAIVGANPQAFKDGNLNGLKVGIRLTIPATRDINRVPAELATEEVMAHDKAWNEQSVINHIINPPYIDAAKVTGHNETAMPGSVHKTTHSSLKGSKIPEIPKFNMQAVIDNMPQLLPTNTAPAQTNKIPQSTEQYFKTKAELDITTAAVESVRESNALLMEQLHSLQDQNKQLQQQLQHRDQDMEQMRLHIQEIVKQRLAVAAQASSPNNDNSSLLWPIVLLLLATGGGGFAYWYFKIREPENDTITYTSEPLMDPKTGSKSLMEQDVVVSDSNETSVCSTTLSQNTESNSYLQTEHKADVDIKELSIKPPKSNLHAQKSLSGAGDPEVAENQEVNINSTTSPDSTSTKIQSDNCTIQPDIEESIQEEEHVLEFESGLYELINKKPVVGQSLEQNTDGYEGLDFTPSEAPTTDKPLNDLREQSKTVHLDDDANLTELDPDVTEFFAQHNLNDESNSIKSKDYHDDSAAFEDSIEASNSLKSTKALDTLLALARTYVSMDDFESARSSLEEVILYGSEKQKQDASQLLADIKDK